MLVAESNLFLGVVWKPFQKTHTFKFATLGTRNGATFVYPSGGLVRIGTDGRDAHVVSDPARLDLPSGVAATDDETFVSEVSSLVDGDVFVYTH
jgi:hypothetical protein